MPTKRKLLDKFGQIQPLRLIIVVATLAPILSTPVRCPQITMQLPTQDAQAISCTSTIPAPNKLPQTTESLYNCPTNKKYRPHTHASLTYHSYHNKHIRHTYFPSLHMRSSLSDNCVTMDAWPFLITTTSKSCTTTPLSCTDVEISKPIYGKSCLTRIAQCQLQIPWTMLPHRPTVPITLPHSPNSFSSCMLPVAIQFHPPGFKPSNTEILPLGQVSLPMQYANTCPNP